MPPPPPKRPPMRSRGLTPEQKARAGIFAGKDAWGYRFAQPIMRLENEMMKRAPEDKERERINAVLLRDFELDPKKLNEGFDGEEIPWGMLRAELKSRRRTFAEAVRESCKKSRGGMIGIQQTHFLAHEHRLMHTFRARADRMAFPLELAVEASVLKSTWTAQYVLHLDRVFYPFMSLPQKSRFDTPVVVADAYRLLDGRGESVIRTHDRKVLMGIEASPVPGPEAAFDWRMAIDGSVYSLQEPRAIRVPSFTVKDESGKLVGEGEYHPDAGSAKVDMTFRFDVAGDTLPWLALTAVYLDAFTQRVRGILGRAERANTEREEADQKAAAELEKEKL